MKHTFKSPIGFILLEGNERALTGISAADKSAPSEKNLPSHFKKAQKQLTEYFDGKRKTFDLPLEFDAETGQFRKKVWQKMARIPFGKTLTYGELAARAGNPKAARAAGGACNKNPFLIVLPCHRVVGANGDLTGFACGLNVKKKLLALEK